MLNFSKFRKAKLASSCLILPCPVCYQVSTITWHSYNSKAWMVGRVNYRGKHFFLDFKKALVFKCEIYMYRKQKQKFVKIQAP